MRTLKKFTGINNVEESRYLGDAELTVAQNVDISNGGKISRRDGYAKGSATRHANLWQGNGFMLATRGSAGDLVNVDADHVLAEGMGHGRVWYCNLPNGGTLYNNGTVAGITTGMTARQWAIPTPASAGSAADTAGSLHPGEYGWALTHQRISDGKEGGAIFSGARVTVTSGGIAFTGLPTLAGHRTNVYLTGANGQERFYAGYTTGSTFSYTGRNEDLQQRLLTADLAAPPSGGSIVGFWRGRVLLAKGSALFASRPHAWHLFDLVRDFKQFSGQVTMVQPVDGGIWVGTDQELVFLAGSTWDQLARQVKVRGAVVLGSGVQVPGKWLGVGDGRAEGDCMVCICDGWLVAGTGQGALVPLTVDRYRTDATQVWATFRMAGDTPQYIAVPQ